MSFGIVHLTSYPDDSWTGGVFTEAERRQMLDFSFRHWKRHSPYLKGYLALTLQRRGRPADAHLVWDSVMDSAKTDADTGTSWAPEDAGLALVQRHHRDSCLRPAHARELAPRDPRREGLVQWLFLHKKLNHWSSTRSTAEVLYALAHYLRQENQLGVREDATVKVGAETQSFVFEPDAYTGKATQVVIPGSRVDAARSSSVVVEKTTPGMLFASATCTTPPIVCRKTRQGTSSPCRGVLPPENRAGTWTLVPIAEGAALATGDESRSSSRCARSRRPSTSTCATHVAPASSRFTLVSRFQVQTGLGLYEEVRDSARTSSSNGSPRASTRSAIGSGPPPRAAFRVARRRCSPCTRPSFAGRSAGTVLEVSDSGR